MLLTLGFVSSNTVVSSEDSVSLRVTSTQTKAYANPDWEGSSLEKEDGCQDTATQT